MRQAVNSSMMRALSGLILTIFFAVASSTALAGLQEGISAYKNGNYPSAINELRPLANNGNAVAQYWLGVMHSDEKGVQRDDQQAMSWYQKAAEQGNTEAQLSLGQMYSDGKGGKRGSQQAMKWYQKAAERGNVEAQLNLGLMYFNGEGAPIDLIQSCKWLNIASTRGGERVQRIKEQVEVKMIHAQIVKAQALAREWIMRR